MASSVDAIKHKVNHVLYSRKSAITSRTFQNHLVEKGILSDEQLEEHHKLIDGLYWEWRTGFYAQHIEHHQRLPTNPQTPESLPPQTAPPNTFISSPPEDAQTATDVEMLKEAVASINPSWPLQDGATTSLFLPGDTNHRSAPATRMECLCPRSYIRARTLERNNIEWEGNTINLRWKSLAITQNADQSVQKTRFLVVNEAVANQAGFHLDMLVGADHGLPLLEQIQPLGAEETSSASSSVIDPTEDLSDRSSEDSHIAELYHIPVAYRRPQPATSTLSISASPRDVAIFIREFQAGGDRASKTMESPAGRFTESHNPDRSKRKLSYSDNSGGSSRKIRSVGRYAQR